jgi:hypothetical protein
MLKQVQHDECPGDIWQAELSMTNVRGTFGRLNSA